jgi:glutathione synthase/RimK-type ligase-like ATP-grasp enzyme
LSKIVSYHPLIQADDNKLLVSQRPLDQEDSQAIADSDAVVLPHLCRPDLYELVTSLKKPHFPRQAVRLSHDGKVGGFRLFTELNLPQPKTMEFATLEQSVSAWEQGRLIENGLEPPLVAKGAGGGMGDNVFLVNTQEELAGLQGSLETNCAHGPEGLVLQEYIETKGRDCRVVFIGNWRDAFWREVTEGEFRANLSQGGQVMRDKNQTALARAKALAGRLKRAIDLDIAAVDLLFAPNGEPLLLEINHYFGREAIGGGDVFRLRYFKAVQGWLASIDIDPNLVTYSP